MRSRSTPELAGRCPACRLRLERCLCDEVTRIAPDIEIVVVRHALEGIKSTNTARLAALAIPSLRIVEYGAKDHPVDGALLATAGACLLYPGPAPSTPPVLPTRLIVLDGNWTQARRMFMRLTALHPLPKLSVAPPAVAPVRARRAPAPAQLSTIEAIAGALEALSLDGGPNLRDLAGTFATRVLETRGHATHPFDA